MTPEQIKQQKQELGWTFKEIAEATGTTGRMIQYYVAGKHKPKKSWVFLFESICKQNKKNKNN
jgi:predicted transcriptional regulator